MIAEQEALLAQAPEAVREAIEEKLAWMRETDMAVVVSQSQGEIEELKKKGLDIIPHRKRMVEEDLEAHFKDGAQAIRNQLGPADISALAARVEALLDANILGVEITAPVREGGDTKGMTDLSAIDFEKLAEAFFKAPKTTVEQLRAKATEAVEKMAAQNPSRVDLIEKLEKLIDAYNAATATAEETFEKLKAFIRSLDEEQGRAAREGLGEGELAIYDILTRPEPKLTKAQDQEVKKVARELLQRLHDKVAVFEWQRRQQTRGDVRWTIEEVLNGLPDAPYPEELWKEKVETTWTFVFSRMQSAAMGAGG